MAYQFDHAWNTERERLADIEAVLDPPTIEIFRKIDVQAGWKCLEVGAGSGCIAKWLCDAVGPTGDVVAVDVETKFLEVIDQPNLEVRQHDIVVDDLESESFDLIHARAVLEHLPDRENALRKMLDALKPSGTILIQDADYVSFVRQEESEELSRDFDRKQRAFFKVLTSAGWDAEYGRKVSSALRRHGINGVQSHVYGFEWGGNLHGTLIWKYAFERVRDRVVDEGLLSDQEADHFLSLIVADEFRAISPLVCASWGKK